MVEMPSRGHAADASVDRRSGASTFDLFSLSEAYFEDPSPYFRELRDHSPIHVNRDGSLLLTPHDDVKLLWRDLSGLVDKREMFKARFGDGPLLEHPTSSMRFRDPPDH